jgi:excisionase family DNA binding protein
MGSVERSAYIPSAEDTKLSQESSRLLASYLNSHIHQIAIVEPNGNSHTAIIPEVAYRLLVDVLTQMAQGNAVSLTPIHAELSPEEAADLLNVSPKFVMKQIESGEIPHHRVGADYRIRYHDLMAYQEQSDRAASQALDEMVAISQELGLYE